MAGRIGKVILAIFGVYLLYAILTVALVPIFGSRAPEIERSGSVPQAIGGERAACIEDNEQALILRLQLIEQAQNEIILSTFDFGNDESGHDMMAALKHAAERGVDVKILVDSMYGGFTVLRSPEFRALSDCDGVEIKLYNPVNLLMPWKANYRMHDKYLIIDNETYLLGGRNTTDLFLGAPQSKQNMDREVLVCTDHPDENHSVHQVRAYFDQVWALDCCKTLNFHGKETALQMLDERYQELTERYPQMLEVVDWREMTIPVRQICFFFNPVDDRNKEPQLWRELCAAMEQGDEILIQTPYIICSNEMYNSLTSLTSDGRQIQIVTNAVKNGANPWGCTDYLNQQHKIRATGVEVFEYIGAHSLHTKTVLVNDRMSMIGSFNMDMRSAYLDTETMLYIDSPEINAFLREGIERDMNQCNHVLPDGTEIPGPDYVDRPFGVGKMIFYTILRVLIIPFRHLL